MDYQAQQGRRGKCGGCGWSLSGTPIEPEDVAKILLASI